MVGLKIKFKNLEIKLTFQAIKIVRFTWSFIFNTAFSELDHIIDGVTDNLPKQSMFILELRSFTQSKKELKKLIVLRLQLSRFHILFISNALVAVRMKIT